MCGIFGIENSDLASYFTYLGLYALQHRGQESAGIASWDGKLVHVERGMGEISEIFSESFVKNLEGFRAIGHTRYSTAGVSSLRNAQPIAVNTSLGPLAIVHNGNIVNATFLREQLEKEGSIFQTTSDTEVILHLVAKFSRDGSILKALYNALLKVKGAYSLLLIAQDSLIAAKDPWGFRPLVMGKIEDAICFASENCAFDLIGAEFIRELKPGEIVVVQGDNVQSFFLPSASVSTPCLFELVYFSRPDSTVFGEDVAARRIEMGKLLAKEAPVDADIVSPVPDSGLFAALGFAQQSGIPFSYALIRNHYVGRTFIQPTGKIRDFRVKVKLNPVKSVIKDRRLVLVDDSIVRGTTSRKLIRMLREAGAKEVHFRVSSPPTKWPCCYGIDTPTKEELIAANKSIEEIRNFLEVDSLAYLSLDALLSTVNNKTFCTACWNGDYPVTIPKSYRRSPRLFPIKTEEDI